MNNKGKDFNNLKQLLISIFLIYMDKEIVEKKPNFKAEVAIVESLTHSTW